jgi:hypothetical protein
MDPLVVILLVIGIPAILTVINQSLDRSSQARKNAKEMRKMLDKRDVGSGTSVSQDFRRRASTTGKEVLEQLAPSIFILSDGQQVGPFSEQRLREGIDDGEFFPDDLAWTTGKASWQPLSALINLDLSKPPPLR